MGPFNVLIVEDNLTFRHALAEILQSQFPEMVIAQAGSGGEAIEKIPGFNPDLVFMDVRLPGEIQSFCFPNTVFTLFTMPVSVCKVGIIFFFRLGGRLWVLSTC